jgi:hypothetical protein
MNVNRQIAQHRARIRTMKQQAMIGAVMLVVLLALCISAFILHWHIILKVLVIIPLLGMLAHVAAPYTRIKDHQEKIRQLQKMHGIDSDD